MKAEGIGYVQPNPYKDTEYEKVCNREEIDTEIMTNLPVFIAPENDKLVSGMPSVCAPR